MLVAQLPPESATATALRLDARDNPAEVDEPEEPADPDAEQWSRGEHLLARIHDELHVLRWLYTSAHTDPKTPPAWKPEPLPRPGVALAATAAPPLRAEQFNVLAAHLARTQGSETTYN